MQQWVVIGDQDGVFVYVVIVWVDCCFSVWLV